MPLRARPLALALAAALLAGCKLESSGPSDNTNIPAVSASTSAFAFTVAAKAFTYTNDFAGPTAGDSLIVGLAVEGFTGGHVLVEVKDSRNVAIFSQQVTSDVAQAQVKARGPGPYHVHMDFSGFTGSIALGIVVATQ